MSEQLTFEQAMKRLEEITNIIQKNECSLDEGLALYEEGLKLARFCNDKLNDFSTKLEQVAGEQKDD